MDEIIMLFDKEELKILEMALDGVNTSNTSYEDIAKLMTRVKNGLYKIDDKEL